MGKGISKHRDLVEAFRAQAKANKSLLVGTLNKYKVFIYSSRLNIYIDIEK